MYGAQRSALDVCVIARAALCYAGPPLGAAQWTLPAPTLLTCVSALLGASTSVSVASVEGGPAAAASGARNGCMGCLRCRPVYAPVPRSFLHSWMPSAPAAFALSFCMHDFRVKFRSAERLGCSYVHDRVSGAQ